ncbi:chorismate-binding protein [Prevotella intermedia]|uniref:Chorismate-binding protein n=1 Tax=Prevotella intermedia TaxID=28131 RepID=A0AAJ3RKL7_PREIN|nr:aminotransferase class IV [Prevotella intermedia]PIK18556.1 chorismate-binding protein [Prevotella intermedia]
MCQFIETMCVEQGKIINLDYHLERIKNTRKHFWNTEKTVPTDQLSALAATQDSRAKLRFTYDKENIYDLSCTPYNTRKIERLKLLESNDIEYRYKSVDRSEINLLKAQTEPTDEIIIVKQNRLTDTSYTNIALFDGSQWITPSTPLLKGTRRAQLLDAGRLIECEVLATDLKSFQSISLINAMMDLEELVLSISSIENLL